ncbi:hypothetical protein K493DRAFT_297702 [Basidiobolus meristosporus CBS 931.73]|uniref:RRM domain-containing protein n=1 Tax=Basidiobolus meristosporus CBS 931.73 TaxID=1314790 RepID=A0A1Y1YY82_9FUNG|nr:hypothetical protein K493DRAFT_297702 [Basidiobolus meristosporus CBS 931.73]|eukprot:ORY02906.1 hypothetical protein K493DRAFT_297702 [Basidiobolus meristosporus CBS 931.73]
MAPPLLVSPQYQVFNHQYQNNNQFPHILPQIQNGNTYGGMGRTIYVGNISSDTPVDEVLGQVRGGPIESVKLLPEKNCIFISFLDGNSAHAFYHDANTKKIMLRGQDLKVGWGKPSPVPSNVLVAVQTGATRNVYLGSLDEFTNEDSLREELSVFGPIDTIKIIREKNIGFVHFLSITNAVKCVATLQSDPKWSGKRVNYGKDRCAQPTKTSQNNGYLANNGVNNLGYSNGYNGNNHFNGISFDPYSGGGLPHDANGQFSAPNFGNAGSNRTIYLGNIHPETTCEDICNVVRGGILHQIRFMTDKHIAFVSFVDPNAAMSFYNLASYTGIVIKNRRLKVGWGKNTPLPPAVAMAVQSGATRNVYIGNIDDSITEEKLKQDFSVFGEIELVNTLKDKNCAFVNFTNILSAVKAIDGIKSNMDYANFRINYGKDRCGNPPRPPKNGNDSELANGFPASSTTENFIGEGSLYDGMMNGVARGV